MSFNNLISFDEIHAIKSDLSSGQIELQLRGLQNLARKIERWKHRYLEAVWHQWFFTIFDLDQESQARLVGERLGLNINTHSMRKSRGWVMFSDGVPIEKISKVLNHSTPAVTMRYLGITKQEVLATYDEYEL